MRTLSQTTRIRIENKFSIKIRIQNPVDGMMKQSVADICLVNITWFWIINPKSSV